MDVAVVHVDAGCFLRGRVVCAFGRCFDLKVTFVSAKKNRVCILWEKGWAGGVLAVRFSEKI